MKLTPLDSLGSCETNYVYFKPIKLRKHEFNHFEGNQNTIISLFRSLTSDHEKVRETNTQLCQHIGLE